MVDISLIRSDTFILIKLYNTTNAKLPEATIITIITKPKSADSLKLLSFEARVTFTTSSFSIRVVDTLLPSSLLEFNFNNCALYFGALLNISL